MKLFNNDEREENNMEERMEKLYQEVKFLLDQAPEEDECTDEENEIYDEMANLINCMENAGYGV